MSDVALIALPAPGSRRGSRWAAASLLVAAVAYVVLSSGGLGWPRGDGLPASTGTSGRAATTAPGPDPRLMANAARHHVVPLAGDPGTLVASDADYSVRFDAKGFSVAPTGHDGAMGISLRAVDLGGRVIAPTGDWAAQPGGAGRLVAPGVDEVVTVRDGEVEWDVVLAAAPDGDRDLVVDADLTGAARVGRDGSGLGVSLAGGGRVRIGAMVVKDAVGSVLHRAVPDVDGSRLRLVVPHRVLAAARYPVTLDPTVGRERWVRGDAGMGNAPDVAFDGTNYLVVWTDSRNGTKDIYGARVGTDGTILDPGGFPISTALGDQSRPVVAYTGSNYLVVWEDGRSVASDIYAAAVTTGGVVIDTGGAPFSTAPGVQIAPAIAVTGSSALIVWADGRSGNYDIYGSRWNTTSGLLDAAGIPISTATSGQFDPAVSFTGADYLVAWSDGRSTTYDIYASRVSTGGVVRDGAGAPFSTAAGSQTSPAIAYDGTYALIVWEDARSGAGYDVYGARWDPAAGLVDPGGLAIARGVQDEISPDVAANGTFLVVWSDSRWRRYDLYATRVQANGTVTDPEGFALTMGTGSGGTAPSVIKGHGGNWTTVYEYDRAAVWNTISPK